jgi:hypothetical protein
MAMGGKQTVYRGHEGVREWLRDLYETLSEFHAEYPEIRDLGDRTVPIGRVSARGTAYLDPKQALEAAGLRE